MFRFHIIFIAFLTAGLAEYGSSDNVIAALEDEQRNVTRYLEYIDDDGIVHLLDTQPPESKMLKLQPLYAKASARQDQVNFLLSTKQNRDPQPIATGNFNALRNTYFNPNVTTVFIVHGWWGSADKGPNTFIIPAFLDTNDANIIAVDWSDGAQDPDYFVSVGKVPDVGKRLAELITYLNQATGASLDNMHLIGHSLGAHIVGNAGRAIGEKKVARITALDPAGPLWHVNPNRLRKTDAKYVEAIHTNGGPLGFGTLKEWGETNFYPNGGIKQPGCILPTCSHSRSYELFASTVKFNNLIGRKCSNIAAMLFDNCNGEIAPLGNSDLTKSGSGVYRLDTGSSYPFNKNSK